MAEAASGNALTLSTQPQPAWVDEPRPARTGEAGQPIGEPPPVIEPVGFDDPFETRPVSTVLRPMRRSFLAPAASGAVPAERYTLPTIRPRTVEAPAAPPAPVTEIEAEPVRTGAELSQEKTPPAMLSWWHRNRVRGLMAALLIVLLAVVALSLRPKPGEAEAELAEGIKYAKGTGTKQDYTAAAKHFRAAAEMGLPRAQYDLGVLYERGRGVPLDYPLAVTWYKRAAEGKHPLAQYNLAVAYSKGEGVDRNLYEAAVWYHRAALQGVVPAMVNLAILYERGEGVPVSLPDAYAWYRAAARRGNKPAARRGDELLQAFTVWDQTQAEAKTREVSLAIQDSVGESARLAEARPGSPPGGPSPNYGSGFAPAPQPAAVNEAPVQGADKNSDTGDVNP